MINMAIIGLGGAGCKLTDSFLSLTRAYDGYFMNSNSNEVKKLINADSTNIVHISGSNGTARNPKRGEKQIKDNQEKIGLFFEDKTEYSMVTLVSSTSGGFGSGSVWGVIDIIKDVMPNCKINLIGVLPRRDGRKYEIENTLLYYVNLNSALKKGKVDGYTFVLNDKMGGDEKVFNEKVMGTFLEGIEASGVEIDDSDVLDAFTSGYNVILDLNDEVISSHTSLHSFVENSVFAIADMSISSDYMLAQLEKGRYNKFTVEKEFNVKKMVKSEYNEVGTNTILFGGCKKPSSYFKKYESCLNDIKAKEKEEEIDDYIPSISLKDREPKLTNMEQPTSNRETITTSKPISKKERRNRLKNILK